uniref:Tubulin-specific chaperone E n=1 Tax=Cyprinus carpio TaxID=7962 RepID=A0A8C2IR43_CYPCA
MKAQEVLEDAVGRRVSCDGERGTVRYVGPVPPTAGLWLGVEWDDPERGKHDGSHEGVRYFTCRHPTGGSFVRPKKASFGVDYVTALKQRYEVELQEVIGEELKISSRTVMMVGFEDNKVKTVKYLKRLIILLQYNCKNKVKTVKYLKRLKILIIIIYYCKNKVLHCAPMWQHLEELYLADNDITELLRPHRVLQTLKVLDLSNNHIVQETVLEISHLPCLEKLNLSSSGLSVIQFSDASAGNKTALFPALKTLLLDDNNISEWCVVNELEKLSSLLHLSCRRNPLLQREKNPETVRQIIIARLSRLELLDMRKVLSDERRGAELDYCKKFGLDWLKAGGHSDPEKNHPNTEFMSEHPRFLALLQKYGAPDEGELKEQKPFALKNQLLTLTFVCPEDSERKPIEKKLPGSMIVQKVKGLLHRLLKLPGMELKLSYTCSKMAGREIEIDNDLKPLEFYSVEDGDRILVRWS